MSILITAGLTGIGHEIAKILHEKKLDVVVTTSKKEKVDENNNCFYLNLSEIESIKNLVNILASKNIQIDTIYHCAHAFSEAKLFLNIKSQDLLNSLNTNVVGTFEFLKVFLKQMTRAKNGRVLVIGSSLAKKPAPGKLIYITEKNAIEALVLSLNSEVNDKGVLIKIIHPALIATQQAIAKIDKSVINKIGRENLLEPRVVALEAITFLENRNNNEIVKILNGNQKW